jgi:hypothetical protein
VVALIESYHVLLIPNTIGVPPAGVGAENSVSPAIHPIQGEDGQGRPPGTRQPVTFPTISWIVTTTSTGPFPQVFPQGDRVRCERDEGAGAARSAFGAGAIQQRSAAEQRDQFGPLTVAQAADRLGVGDPAAGEHAIGPGGTDPRYDQQLLAHLRRLRAARRVGEHPCKRDPAGGDLSLQLRTCETNLVRPRERAQPLLGRPSRGWRAAHNRHGADSTSTRAQVEARDKPERQLRPAGSVHAAARQHVVRSGFAFVSP